MATQQAGCWQSVLRFWGHGCEQQIVELVIKLTRNHTILVGQFPLKSNLKLHESWYIILNNIFYDLGVYLDKIDLTVIRASICLFLLDFMKTSTFLVQRICVWAIYKFSKLVKLLNIWKLWCPFKLKNINIYKAITMKTLNKVFSLLPCYSWKFSFLRTFFV